MAHNLHPIEVTAHAILSRPLDNLGESLGRLGESQLVLLARLRLMQSVLTRYESAVGTTKPTTLDDMTDRIKSLRKRIAATVSTLERVDAKVDSLLEKVVTN